MRVDWTAPNRRAGLRHGRAAPRRRVVACSTSASARGARRRSMCSADAVRYFCSSRRSRSATPRSTIAGARFGRRPLAPRLSPKKTIEGAIGGFVVAPVFLFFAGPLLCACGVARCIVAAVGVALVIAGHCRRSLRIDAQARRRREGQFGAHSRSRRRARSHRRAAVRRRRCSTCISECRLRLTRVDEAHRHPRFDRLDRHERARGGRRASRPRRSRRPCGRRQRRNCLPRRCARYRPRAVAMASGPALDAAARGVDGPLPLRATARAATGLIAVATHPDVDVVLCASSGTAALEADARGDRGRQDHRPRQQGSAGDGRWSRDGCGAAPRRRHSARRQRAQRDSSVPARRGSRTNCGG